jgi:ATP-dependent exoDNAse (exonuclease V) beta subunit
LRFTTQSILIEINLASSLHYGTNDSYFNATHEPSNIKLGGGVDDVFLNTETDQIHIIDYKSTAQGTQSPKRHEKKPVSLDEPWKAS